jgi:hypothetical protein
MSTTTHPALRTSGSYYMQTRNDQPNIPGFNFGVSNVFVMSGFEAASIIPGTDNFLLSDGSNMLLSDGTKFLIVS